MTLSERWQKNGRLKLVAALLINAAFLLLVLCLFTLGSDGNDDFYMSLFVDDRRAETTAFVPFINIAQGLILKLVYELGADSLPWYGMCQYLLMLCGFSAMTWGLLCRFRLPAALAMTGIILFSSGMDAYITLNFSKTAAISTVGGLSLMLYALRNESRQSKPLALILGFIMALLGFTWRIEVFFSTAAIMAPVGLVALLELLHERRGSSSRLRIKGAWDYAKPFLLLLAAVISLQCVNVKLRNTGEYGHFREFNLVRGKLMDNGMPPKFEQAADLYVSLDMDENAVYILRSWNFYDTEKFSLENMKCILERRNSMLQKRSAGEVLNVLFTECIPSFAGTVAFAAAGLMLALWLVCGGRRWQELLGAGMTLLVFCLIYMVMIYTNRCLINRVDMGLFLAVAMALSFFMDSGKPQRYKVLCPVLLIAALLIGGRAFLNRCPLSDRYSMEDKSGRKAAAETILSANDKLYLYTIMSLDDRMYSPLELAPAGFADRIVPLGGWSLYHPSVEHVLDNYGIENPYPDMIDNESVLLIDSDVERTLAYLQKYYEPSARAEAVEPLSSETGLSIYRIVS